MLIREFILSSVSVFLFDKEQAKATNEARKDNYLNLFNNFRQQANATPGDKANAVNLLGVELAKHGFKKESIYTRRSEFLRVWDNISFVSEDCNSWAKALRQIREATTPESLILIDKMVKLMESIEAAQTQLMEVYAEWQSLSIDPAEAITFSDESAAVVDTRQLRAA